MSFSPSKIVVLVVLMSLVRPTLAQQSHGIRPAQVIDLARSGRVAKPPVISAVALSPGGKLLASAGDDHLVRIWSTNDGRLVHTLKGHADWVRTVAFSPDGRSIASAGSDRQIILWDVPTGKQLRVLARHKQAIYSIAYSPDGRMLAAIGFEHEIRVYDLQGHVLLHELHGPTEDLRAVAFSPDSQQMAVAGRNGQICVWSMPAGFLKLEIAAGVDRIRSLSYSPAGDKLVSAGEGGIVGVWKADNGQEIAKLRCRPAKVMSMAFCGVDQIATGGSDNVIRIWDLSSKTEVYQLLGHTGSVGALACDLTSATLVSGSFDTTVRVWLLGNPDSMDGVAGETNRETTIR